MHLSQPRALQNRHALRYDRCGSKYYPGSDFHFCIWNGSTRRGSGNYLITGIILYLGAGLPLRKKTFLKIKASNLKLTRSIIMPSLALGLSTFIMQSSESVISVCFNSSLLKYGGDIAVGAMTILTSVMQFAMLPLQGLGQGAQPIISYNYGAKLTGRVRSAYKLLLALSLSYASLLWLGVMLAPQAFAAMFTSDPALIDFTKHALRIYMACMFLFGIQMACQMTFTAIGNAKASILVAVMRKFILLLPLIYLVPKFMPSDPTTAVYLAEPIADFFAVSFTAVLFFFQFKKALRALEE